MELKNKKELENLKKSIDDFKNNEFARNTQYNLQAIKEKLPQMFRAFGRDKDETHDSGRAFLDKNKRRRKRDVIEHPKNVLGPK